MLSDWLSSRSRSSVFSIKRAALIASSPNVLEPEKQGDELQEKTT
jgi:hypothetical protein